MKLSHGGQIVSHQDDIELLQWQDNEIIRLSKALRINSIEIDERQRLALQINDYSHENNWLKDKVAVLENKLEKLYNPDAIIKPKNTSTNKAIVTVAVIITIINIIIFFCK
jgi:hypothetical protein